MSAETDNTGPFDVGPSVNLRRVLLRPSRAVRTGPAERALAIIVVAVATGLLMAMAMYVLRERTMAPAWASERTMGVIILVAGSFTKLLVDELRASVATFVTALIVAMVGLLGLYVAPFYLLGISTLGGYALLPIAGDALTFGLIGMFPLAITGWLLVVVWDGMLA